MIWQREPFFGGCRYYGENNLTVVGYYSPVDPLEFESDCKAWMASNIPGCTFSSAKEAMEAAEHLVTIVTRHFSTFEA